MDINLFVTPLLKLLNDEHTSTEDIAMRVMSSFPSSDRFKVACTLSMLLTDHLLPFPQVRYSMCFVCVSSRICSSRCQTPMQYSGQSVTFTAKDHQLKSLITLISTCVVEHIC